MFKGPNLEQVVNPGDLKYSIGNIENTVIITKLAEMRI